MSIVGLLFGQVRGRPRGGAHVNAQHADISLYRLQVYNSLTPDMYEKSSHTSIGWWVMALAVALNVVDVGRFLLRFTRWGKTVDAKSSEKGVEPVFQIGDDEDDESTRLVHSPVSLEHEHGDAARWPSVDVDERRGSTYRGQSFSDEGTVCDAAGPDSFAHGDVAPRSTRAQRWGRYGGLALDFAQRMLILLGYVELCTGVSVWTGACRERYLNG